MQLRTIRLVGIAVLGSVIAAVALIGLAVGLVTCYDYPFRTRDEPPTVPALPRSASPSTERITFPLPIVDDPLVSTDQRMFETDQTATQVFAFYQQQLVAEGWETDYTVNLRTNQMYILNKQACPYYGLGITVTEIGYRRTRVLLDPYLKDRCDCN